MSEYITVKHLKDLCEEQIEKGNGDKQILISADEEGNTFNPLMFSFVDDAKTWETYYLKVTHTNK